MTSMMTLFLRSFVLPFVFTMASVGQSSGAKPQATLYHLGGQPEQLEYAGNDWTKRQVHEKPDYYGFLTDERKRFGHLPEEDFMSFVVGEKKSEKKQDKVDYWDFVGADNFKRSHLRRRRSSQEADQKQETSQKGKRMIGDSHTQGFSDWDDFILGKRGAVRDPNVRFEDFLVGEKRKKHPLSDYDYADFVLGKRP